MRVLALLGLLTLASCSSPTAPPICPLVKVDTLRNATGAPQWEVEVRYCAPAPLPR